MAFLNPFLQNREQISNLPSRQKNVKTLSNMVEKSDNKTAAAHSSTQQIRSRRYLAVI
jgi:hypothetical protein